MRQGGGYVVLCGGVVGGEIWMLTPSARIGLVCNFWSTAGGIGNCCVVVGLYVRVCGYGVFGVTN